MGFIYRFIFIFNNLTYAPKVRNKYVNRILVKLNLVRLKKNPPIYFVNFNHFFSILFFNLKNFNFKVPQRSLKLSFLPFIIKHMPTIFFSFIDNFEKSNKVQQKKNFKHFKSSYKLFFITNIFRSRFMTYYYILFFNRFFLSVFSFFYFRIFKSFNASDATIKFYLLLTIFINLRGNCSSLKFVNTRSIANYSILINSFDIKKSVLTNSVTTFTYNKVRRYFDAFHNAGITNIQNNIKSRHSSPSLNSNYIFNTGVIKRSDANSVNVMFIKLNKIYNKGKFARNKQIYRTGVIWCLWLTILTICAPFYYFYSFNFIFTYIWFLFFFLIARFVFSFFSKNNTLNYWEISTFFK
jgi:hypothetical protein